VHAELPPTIAHVNDARLRLARTDGARPDEQPLDDWLGDVSDDDWSEGAAERADRRRGAPADQGVHEGDLTGDSTAARPAPARPVDAAEAHRAAIQRRRLVAGLVCVVVVGVAVALSVLLLRGGPEEPVASAPPTPAPTETSPSSTPTTPPTPSTTTPTPTTTPSTSGASAFTLPEGTKLRLGEGDPALVRKLQQALTTAGYDPGSVDGTFGRRTEAAVVAFQQANGLSADGVVGPKTASALDTALTTTPSTSGASPAGFALPEGTKLRFGEGDPALVRELQQALASAGYDPGAADGNFGRRTQAAVVAFQEANGLSGDGVVGPETASALNSAVAGG
jgi:peptidoglycan hydrolase-like protein with peptidoglycan-binding domain